MTHSTETRHQIDSYTLPAYLKTPDFGQLVMQGTGVAQGWNKLFLYSQEQDGLEVSENHHVGNTQLISHPSESLTQTA